jgi:hypothetical protein
MADQHLAAIIASIRDEYETETGERPSDDVAEILLDRMCDAFVHKLGGAGAEYAVRDDMRTAEYLAHRWAGKDGGAQLQAAIDKVKAEPRTPKPPKRSSIEMQSRYWCAACSISVSCHAKTEVDQVTHDRACDLLRYQVEAMPMIPLPDELPHPMDWRAWVEYVREWDVNPRVVFDVPNGIHPRTGKPPRVHKADRATGLPECGSGDGPLCGPYSPTRDDITCPYCLTDYPRDAHTEAWAQGPI